MKWTILCPVKIHTNKGKIVYLGREGQATVKALNAAGEDLEWDFQVTGSNLTLFKDIETFKVIKTKLLGKSFRAVFPYSEESVIQWSASE